MQKNRYLNKYPQIEQLGWDIGEASKIPRKVSCAHHYTNIPHKQSVRGGWIPSSASLNCAFWILASFIMSCSTSLIILSARSRSRVLLLA